MPAMSWEAWARHDATALAERVRKGELTPAELAAQASEAATRLNPKLQGVIELFADTAGNPDTDRPARDGALYGVPMFLKDLGSGLAGRMQDSGSAFTRGTRIDATDPSIGNFL
ncbi:MAG: amidase, partial [Rhodospirillales bacterium]|nr:amidase [Rhodospirillales bacterium]